MSNAAIYLPAVEGYSSPSDDDYDDFFVWESWALDQVHLGPPQRHLLLVAAMMVGPPGIGVPEAPELAHLTGYTVTQTRHILSELEALSMIERTPVYNKRYTPDAPVEIVRWSWRLISPERKGRRILEIES